MAPSETSTVRVDLWGPVVTNESDEFFCGATKGTNNTDELCGIGQGLMWLRDVASNAEMSAPTIVDAPAFTLYHSGWVLGPSLDCETEVEREKAALAPQTRQLAALWKRMQSSKSS